MTDYAEQDATGLAALVRDGEASADELLSAARARADAVNPRINAVVRFIDAAEPADGPLRGVPFLLKDLYQHYAGVPTSGGSRALATLPATEHATVTQRWLDAGLTIFGKTNTPEFGAKGVTEPKLFGPARNPWNLDHTPGGSSGGAAAAVAAGIVPVAAASDGGGSIRIPASCCGLFGLKPGRGLVPAGPAVGEGLLGSSTDGVISRSVRDTAVMLDILSPPAAEAPYAAARPERPFADEVGQAPGKLRIALCTASSINPQPDREAIAAVAAAGKLLESLGHEVTHLDAAPFDDAALAKNFLTGWFVAMATSVARTKALTGAGDEGFESDTLVMAALGRATSPVDFMGALEDRQLHIRRLAAFHAEYDLLVTPTTASPPPAIGAFDQPRAVEAVADVLLRARGAGLLRHTPIVDQMVQKNLGWVPYTQLANLTGRPAMSVPLHWTAAGLPLGVQFVAALGGEGLLLRLAAQLEDAQPWASRRPPLSRVEG
ncbi:MAG: amidase [Solirubrobacteraceae bacterium]|jgi:Asp-tRNA(Asn)/Glu-tRNA(Gln) amidotransferase A subunit family amidase|nr:amidase [Solirubrobacteraceae bacterium]